MQKSIGIAPTLSEFDYNIKIFNCHPLVSYFIICYAPHAKDTLTLPIQIEKGSWGNTKQWYRRNKIILGHLTKRVNINQQPNLILIIAQSNLMNRLHPLINILYPKIIKHSTMNIYA